MIDLHIHSKYSDGTDSVVEILEKAQKRNLEYISITDHNTCSAYQELKNIEVKKYYKGKIITGIELNTIVLDIPIEILGYDIDVEIMQKNLKGIYLTPNERNYLEIKRLYYKCLKSGVELRENFLTNYSPEKYASQYLHDVLTQNENNKRLLDNEAWNDSLVLYRKYMSEPNSAFFVDMNDVLPTLEKTIELIKQAKGKVFVPHIFEYKHNAKKILKHILENYKVDGLECYYSTFTAEQIKKLTKVCNERKMLISGGSDYHGLNEPRIEMGIGKGDLKIGKSVISNWQNIKEIDKYNKER